MISVCMLVCNVPHRSFDVYINKINYESNACYMLTHLYLALKIYSGTIKLSIPTNIAKTSRKTLEFHKDKKQNVQHAV